MKNDFSPGGWLACETPKSDFCLFPVVSTRPRERCIRHGCLLGPVYHTKGMSRRDVRRKIKDGLPPARAPR